MQGIFPSWDSRVLLPSACYGGRRWVIVTDGMDDTDLSPAEIGRLSKRTGKPPRQIMSEAKAKEEPESTETEMHVARIGLTEYRVSVQGRETDIENGVYGYDLATDEFQTLGSTSVLAENQKDFLRRVVVETAAESDSIDRHHIIDAVRIVTSMMGYGGSSGGGGGVPTGSGTETSTGSGTATGTDGDSDGETPVDTTDVFSAVDGGEDEIETVKGWIEAYSKVKSGLEPEWVEYEYGKVEVPEGADVHSGLSETGVLVCMGNPWDHGQFNNDDNTVTDDWKEAGKALGDMFRSESEDSDGLLYFGADFDYLGNLVTDGHIAEELDG